jgi:NDP-mannose synthase
MKSRKILGFILAGGKGTRLAPYTTFIPKPLMPIGDMPILEVVIRQLKNAGIDEIILAVGHHAQLIQAFIGDGSRFGVKVHYSLEDKPLGTAGPIKNFDFSSIETFDALVVINGDVLTTLNLKEALDAHFSNHAAASICINERSVNIDFGVIKFDENQELLGYEEKPSIHYNVSMGINILSLEALDYVPKDQFYNIPDLMLDLKKDSQKVYCYRGPAYWLDIGRIEDYSTACQIFEERRKEFLLDEK